METAPIATSGSNPLSGDGINSARQSSRWENFEQARQSLNRLRGESDTPTDSTEEEKRELKRAANKMEGVLLNVMVKQMRETVHQSELFQGGRAGEIFQERLDRRYAQTMARKHEFGIAEAIYRQLSGNLTG